MKKFFLTMVAMIMGLVANAAGYYINGAAFGWKSWSETALAEYKFTETSTGVFELDLSSKTVSTLSGEFIIVKIDGTTPDWDNTQVSSNGSNVVPGTPYSYAIHSGNNLSLGSASVSNAKIVLDTNAKTLLVSGQQQANSFETVYLIGDFNGGGWSETLTTYPLAKSGTDTYTGTYTLTGTNYFKPKCGNVTFGSTTGQDLTPEMGTEYTLGSSDKSLKLGAGTYNFKVVADQAGSSCKITVTSDGGQVDPPTPPVTDYTQWYVNVLYENNNMADNGTVANAEGLNTHTGLKIGDKGFKIKTWNEADGDQYWSNGGTVTPGEWTVLPTDGYNVSMTIVGATADSEYDVEFNCATKEVKVTLVNGGQVDPPTPPTPVDSETFVFNTTEGLAALGIPAPPTSATAADGWIVDTSAKTNVKYEMPEAGVTSDGITLKSVKIEGTTASLSSFYVQSPGTDNQAMQFRAYKNNNLTLTAPAGKAFKSVEFVSPKTNQSGNFTFTTGITDENGKVTVDADDSKIFTWTPTTEGNVTTLTFTVSGSTQINTIDVELVDATVVPPTPAEDTIVVVGSFTNNWSLADGIVMTKNENNYTATIESLAAGSEFKIAVQVEGPDWGSSWGADAGVGSSASTVAVENGTEMKAWLGSSANWLVEKELKDVTLTFVRSDDKDVAGSLTVTGTVVGDPEPPVPSDNPVLYLMGVVTDWGATDSYKFTEVDGVYTLTGVKLAGNFKIADADWTDATTYSTKNTSMAVDTEYDVVNGSGFGGDMAMATEIENATVTFNLNTMKFKVTGEAVTDVTKTYWIKGTFNSWTDAEMTADSNNTYSYYVTSNEADGVAQCVIFVKNNDVVGDYFKQEDGTTFNETSPLTLSTNGGDIKFNVEKGNSYKLTFNPTTLELSLTNVTGVEDIAAEEAEAVYYNLQGVRVNKEAGQLLIRVANGKAQKVQF